MLWGRGQRHVEPSINPTYSDITDNKDVAMTMANVSNKSTIKDPLVTITDGTEGIVGTMSHDSKTKNSSSDTSNSEASDDARWYIGIVSPRHEKKVAEKLEKLHYRVFVPTQEVERTWSQGRKRKVDVVVIPSKLFIKVNEQQRLEVLKSGVGVLRYLVNAAGTLNRSGFRPLAVVPEYQIEQFRLMLSNAPSEVEFTEHQLVKGDKVRIISGPLEGLEGVVQKDVKGRTRIYVMIEGFGNANTEIDISTIQLIK